MARAFAIIRMSGGEPDIDGLPVRGYCLAAQYEGQGMYLVTGTAAQLAAVDALPQVYGLCALQDIDNVISAAKRTRINSWLTARSLPTIPAGWSYKQVIIAIYKRANAAYDQDQFFLADI
jgi:hypothetical protein